MPAAHHLPPIIIRSEDYDRLAWIATASMMGVRRSAIGEKLADELLRAAVVGAPEVPSHVVTMNAQVTYRERGRESCVQVVYPEDEDARAGRVSVLTDLGTALLGLSAGQSICWRCDAGTMRHLEVLDVSQMPAAWNSRAAI